MVELKEREVEISMGDILLQGTLALPDQVQGIVVFAHGSGSSRFSPRNRFVARQLVEQGLGTLLIDLLTEEEEAVDLYTGHLRFNILLLAARLIGATDWLLNQEETRGSPIGYFGSSTGAAAALVAAAEKGEIVKAVVSRGGRPDLAGDALKRVQSPTLLIVGGDDTLVIDLNQQAMMMMLCEKRLEIIPGATHLFEEPGKLEEVSRLATLWFSQKL